MGWSLSFNIEGIQLLMSNPLLFVGVFMIIISAVLWVIGMSKFQLSFMYPFLSVNYVIIVVGSEWIFK